MKTIEELEKENQELNERIKKSLEYLEKEANKHLVQESNIIPTYRTEYSLYLDNVKWNELYDLLDKESEDK